MIRAPLWGALASERVAQEGRLGLPRDVSSQGWRIDEILQVTHWMMLFLASVALVWFLWSLLRRRKRGHYTHGATGRAAFLPLSLAAGVLFGVDGFLILRSSEDLDVLGVPPAAEPHGAVARVQIGARQWAWDVRQAGADGAFDTPDDIYSVSELVVPVGRPVVYELSSLDVVHALYLPNLRVKRDAIPGQIQRGWFQVEEEGRFEIACAQHCGVHHYKMRAVLRALAPEDYAKWVKAASKDAQSITAEQVRARSQEAAIQSDSGPIAARSWAWPWRERDVR